MYKLSYWTSYWRLFVRNCCFLSIHSYFVYIRLHLLFRGDVAYIFKILIMKFILLEIVVFCQFIHILLISGYMEKKLNLYCLWDMLLKFLQFNHEIHVVRNFCFLSIHSYFAYIRLHEKKNMNLYCLGEMLLKFLKF